MSRIGKQPITIPSGVSVTIDDSKISVSGSKGNLEQTSLPGLKITHREDHILVERINDEAVNRARHGLLRTLINNMVLGVSQGFEKKLEINGVGYRVAPQGADLKFNLGFSHDV